MDVDAPAPTATSERCPHLLSVYVKPGTFHNSFLFKETSSIPSQDVYQLYVWEETTLNEIVQGLIGLVPDRMRSHQGNWAFRLLSEEDSRGARGKWNEKDLGVVSVKGLEGGEQGAETLLSAGILPPPSNPTPLYLVIAIQNLPPVPVSHPSANHAPPTAAFGGDRVYSGAGGAMSRPNGPSGGAPFVRGGPPHAQGAGAAFGVPRGGGAAGDSWSRGGGSVGRGGFADAGAAWGGARGGGTLGAAIRGAADHGYSSRGGRGGGGMGSGPGVGRGGYGGGRERERSSDRRRRSPSY